MRLGQMEGNDEELDHSSSSEDEDSEEDDELAAGTAVGACGMEEHGRQKREVGELAYGKCECAKPCGLLHRGTTGGQLYPSHAGNPVYGPRMQLYCRTGFHLAILNNGKVRGSPDDFNKFAVMELSSVDISEVRIRGVETNLFLAMNKKGRLYGEEDRNAAGTVFIEELAGMYNTYKSKTWGDWFIGIGKSGKPKRGHKTNPGQKSTRFLPRRFH